MAIINTNSDSFDNDVLKQAGVVLVDMFAHWCGPCKLTEPIIEEMSNDPKYKTVKFVKVDVDADNDIASRYGVMSIPTFIIFKDGKIISQFVGSRDKSGFEKEINQAL